MYFLFVVLNVESFLNWEMPPVVKTSVPLPSPTFPIPGSGDIQKTPASIVPKEQEPESSSPCSSQPAEQNIEVTEVVAEEKEEPVTEPEKAEEKMETEEVKETNTVPFYTPDEEELVEEKTETGDKYGEEEGTSYIPPFNNPVYPNTNFTSYGSVIGRYT